MTQRDEERFQHLVCEYLREFREYGELLPVDQFDSVVASHLGLDPAGSEFLEVQSAAEEMLQDELKHWVEERKGTVHDSDVKRRVPTRSIKSEENAEEVQYVTVDFGDMEEEENIDSDLSIAGKQLDVQVFHFGDTER